MNRRSGTGAAAISTICTVAVLLAGTGDAWSDTDYAGFLRPLGGCHLWGLGLDVVLGQDAAFIAERGGPVRIVATDDPDHPVEIGMIAARSPDDLALAGNLLYVADNDYLLIVDVSARAAPVVLTRQAVPAGPRAVAVEGDLVGLGTYSGLEIYRAAGGPALGSLDLGAPIDAVALHGATAVCASEFQVFVVDIADTAEPRLLAMLVTPRNRKLAFDGRYIHLAGNGYRIIDCQDREAPAVVANVPLSVFDLDVRAARAYLCTLDSGFYVYDVSDPAEVGLLGSIRGLSSYGMGMRGDLVAISTAYEGMYLVDVTNARNAAFTATYAANAPVVAMAVDGQRGYISYQFGGLGVVDLSTPESPVESALIDTPAGITGLAIAGSTLYTTDPYHLRAWDLAAGSAPGQVGSLALLTRYNSDPVVEGDHLYYCSLADGLVSIDVSDATRPGFDCAVGGTGVESMSVGASGYTAWLGDDLGNVSCYDLSDPVVPRFAGELALPHFNDPRAIAAAGPYAFIARDEGWAVALRTKTGAPAIVADNQLPSRWASVALDGDIAYFGGSGGVLVCDIADQANARAIGYLAAERPILQIALSDDHIYAIDSAGHLNIAPKQGSPDVPTVLGSLTCGRAGEGVLVEWTLRLEDGDRCDRLEAAADHRTWPVAWEQVGPDRFRALDISSEALRGGAIRYSVYARRRDGTSFSLGSVAVAPVAGREPAIEGIFPNPANPATTISLVADGQQRMRIAVYDLCGRRVAVLADATPPAGEFRVTWNGSDDAGREVGSGLYVVRLETRTGVSSRKVSLVR